MNGVRRSILVSFAAFLLLVSALSVVSYSEQSATQSKGTAATNEGLLNQYQSAKPLNTTSPSPYDPNATSSHAPGGTGSVQTTNPNSSGKKGPLTPGGSLVQSKYASDGSTYVTSITVSLSSSVTAGDILVAMANVENYATGTTFTISDAKSNTWTTAVEINDGVTTKSGIYYTTVASSGSDSVTLTLSSQSRYLVLSVWEISGYCSSNPVTSSGSGDGSPISVSSVNIASGSFALAGASVDSAGSWTGTSGFTLTTGTDWGFEYTTSPPSSTTASMSLTSATWWSEVLIAFPEGCTASPGVGIVQDKYSYTGSSYVSSFSVTLDNPVSDGNILVAMVNVENYATGTSFIVNDTRGNSWTTIVETNDGVTTKSGAYYAPISSTGGTDTVHVYFSSSIRYAVISVWEIAGYTPLGLVYSSGYGSSGCCSVTQKTISQYSFVLAGAAVDSAGSWTGTSGFTLTTGTDWGFEYTTTPPTSSSAGMSATGSTYWSEVMVGFTDPIPQILNTYNFTSSNSGGTSSVPIDTIGNGTNPSSASGFSSYSECNSLNEGTYTDPFCVWVSTGYINSIKYVQLTWEDNSSKCCDHSPYNYPNGNTTVSFTMIPSGTEAGVDLMSINFQAASGQALQVGNVFVQNYGELLYQSLNDLSSQISSEAGNFLGSNNQTLNTLGENYHTISFAVSDLSSYLQNATNCASCPGDGLANVQVPHISTEVISWKFTTECAGNLALDSVNVVGLIYDSPATILVAAWHSSVELTDIYDTNRACLSYSYP